MKKIVESTNLISQMQDYYDFLTAHTQSTGNITWSPPYLDALGLGLMVTAAVPVVTDRYGSYVELYPNHVYELHKFKNVKHIAGDVNSV